jgi:hypothetical protein
MFFITLISKNSILEIILKNWLLIVLLITLFFIAYISAEIFWNVNKKKAIQIGEILDQGRKKHIQFIHKQMDKTYGIIRVTITIFIFNFFGGIVLWATLGGLLVIFPFMHLLIAGFLVNLALKRYPERKHWLLFPNIIFEIGAIVVIAASGIKLGLNIWSGEEIQIYIIQYKILLFQIAIPFLFIAAICESFLFRHIHIIKGHPWPY